MLASVQDSKSLLAQTSSRILNYKSPSGQLENFCSYRKPLMNFSMAPSTKSGRPGSRSVCPGIIYFRVVPDLKGIIPCGQCIRRGPLCSRTGLTAVGSSLVDIYESRKRDENLGWLETSPTIPREL